MPISQFDIHHLEYILADEKGYNWFTARLLRLIAHQEVAILETWKHGMTLEQLWETYKEEDKHE